ncbi:Imm1 family immunity protein [Saccharothrix xinjiangensis]|uniref:Imm1 family immunity protein n=1 Tax=Saccharothrix xinjiangensis TaxID=204798 RepID=A0ABV9XYU0_9PSEU
MDVDLQRITDPGQLTAMLAAANVEPGSPAGWVWFLRHGTDPDAPTLAVGMRGDIGALEWIDFDSGGTGRFVPVDGLNQDWAEYSVQGGHDQGMPPGAELPLNRVFTAVEEFARTGQRPTSVHWRPQRDHDLTVTASWTLHGHPQDRELATPEDVARLITADIPPSVDVMLLHHGRPMALIEVKNPHSSTGLSARLHPDHEVVTAVHERFGFLLFSTEGHTARLDGDPASAAWTTPGGHRFPAGSGVAVPTLIEAITEFLDTQERPTCVTWRQTQPSTL